MIAPDIDSPFLRPISDKARRPAIRRPVHHGTGGYALDEHGYGWRQRRMAVVDGAAVRQQPVQPQPDLLTKLGQKGMSEKAAAMDQPSRRALLAGILGPIAALGLVALPGKKAQAQEIQDLIDDIDSIEALTDQLVQVLVAAFQQLGGLAIPLPILQTLMAFLDDVFSFAGDDSFTVEDPVGAMERSYPSTFDAVADKDQRKALAVQRADAITLRQSKSKSAGAWCRCGADRHHAGRSGDRRDRERDWQRGLDVGRSET